MGTSHIARKGQVHVPFVTSAVRVMGVSFFQIEFSHFLLSCFSVYKVDVHKEKNQNLPVRSAARYISKNNASLYYSQKSERTVS